VTKAKNLLERSKGGNDAYCIIGLGKEKFLTSVRPKTLNPVWDEQAEFPLGEREDLKVTVYHKSSIIDEFVGRTVLNISDMVSENTRTHSKWYKLMSKEEKKDKKEKERGEIEVRIEFLVKPKAGSILDLSKAKDKSLSLKSLKEKSSSIKNLFGDKLKKLNHKKQKFTGENQYSLAEQAKRMGGSKLDFLDDDYNSLASSYSSINGPVLLTRVNSINKQQQQQMNNTRISYQSSMISDSSSVNQRFGADDEFADNESANIGLQHLNLNNRSPAHEDKSQHSPVKIVTSDNQSNNRSGFLEEINEEPSVTSPNLKRPIESSHKRTSSEISNTVPQSASTPAVSRSQSKVDSKPPLKPDAPKVKREAPKRADSDDNSNDNSNGKNNDSFASIFKASINEMESTNEDKLPPRPNNSKNSSITASFTVPKASGSSLTAKPSMRKLDTSFNTNNEEEIDWASSDDEELQKEIETFERNQVPKLKTNKKRNAPLIAQQHKINPNTAPQSKQPEETPDSHPSAPKSPKSDTVARISTNPFFNNFNPFIPEAFRHPNQFFSTDLDPFSSSSSISASPVLKAYSNNHSFTENHPPIIDNNKDIYLLTARKMDAIQSEEEVVSVEAKTEDSVTKKVEASRRKSVSESSDDEDDKVIIERVIEKTKDSYSAEDKNLKIEPDAVSLNIEPLSLTNNDEKDDDKLELDDEPDKEDDGMNMDDYFKGAEKSERKAHADSDVEEEKEIKSDAMEHFNRQLFNQFDDVLKSVDDLEDDDSEEKVEPKVVIDKLEDESEEIKQDDDVDDDDGKLRFTDGDADAKLSHIDTTDENRESTQDAASSFTNTVLRQSERRKLMPNEDLTSDLNSDNDFSERNDSFGSKNRRSQLQISLADANNNKRKSTKVQAPVFSAYNQQAPVISNQTSQATYSDDDIKTPDIDIDYVFQEQASILKRNSVANRNDMDNRNGSLPDIISSKADKDKSSNKARKFLEGLEGVKISEISVPDQLRKQLELFDREELLQLISYQKKFLDEKESRIKDLDQYIDNIVVKVIEYNPALLMQVASSLNRK